MLGSTGRALTSLMIHCGLPSGLQESVFVLRDGLTLSTKLAKLLSQLQAQTKAELLNSVFYQVLRGYLWSCHRRHTELIHSHELLEESIFLPSLPMSFSTAGHLARSPRFYPACPARPNITSF